MAGVIVSIWAPSAFEAGFVSAAHAEGDIAATLDAAATTFADLAA